ncbi:beta-glucosidase [Agromyces tardus]|uniref:Beta-glucosidase n=2 Tax=Agromyces tardus TaxID=2583849 RepID=A0A3M8AFT6_9MICO|nr:beta-glucosidase [Agromyces tardus]
MTDDERFSLIVSVMGVNTVNPVRDPRIPEGVPMSAGYTPGIPRLGVPSLLMSDASLGVTNPGYRRGDTATALPSGIALGATFDPAMAAASGALVGREARSRGFNVQLAGGVNLARDPRNGRNFEYLSEDPLLTATLAAESIRAIQGEGVISTIKHYSLNCNETNRHWLDAIIDPVAHRESDLLAFEIAIERAQPGSVMTGYNKVNGEYAGGNRILIEDVLKGAWRYPGWVMSDWGATLDWEFANAGLDQESGAQMDVLMWKSEAFTDKLRAAHADGRLTPERLSEMVRRILRSMFAVGVDAWDEADRTGTADAAVHSGAAGAPDAAEHDAIALETARRGIVVLANDGILPLATEPGALVAVIGGYAQLGVPAGTGSSAVTPAGGFAAVVPIGGAGVMGPSRNLYLHPSSPLTELKRLLPEASVDFDPGMNAAEAALLAARADVAIVFAIRPEGESYDLADLSLPWGQGELIERVAAANANTIVVLETGNAVDMPWRDRVRAIVEAWYPGQAGGRAIAEVLTGAVEPSGRLPITFPASLDQTPRPELPGLGTPWGTPTTIRYDEGAEVGHRWFAKTGQRALFPFGHGLSYTSFDYEDLEVDGGTTITASFTVVNTGGRPGADVPQVYLTDAPDGPRLRLLGFERLHLEPGESRRVTIVAEPRVLARYDADAGAWRMLGGRHEVAVGQNAEDHVLSAAAELDGRTFGA